MSLAARLVERVVQILVAIAFLGVVFRVPTGHFLDQLVTLELLVDVLHLAVEEGVLWLRGRLFLFVLYLNRVPRQMVSVRIAVEVLRLHQVGQKISMLNRNVVIPVLGAAQFMLHHLLELHVILLLPAHILLWREHAVLVVLLHGLADRVEFFAEGLQGLH